MKTYIQPRVEITNEVLFTALCGSPQQVDMTIKDGTTGSGSAMAPVRLKYI